MITAQATSDTLAKFRAAMAAFPSGVTLMTTVDREGTPWGFAASSFCSLSMDPPLVLVCLAKTAQCHDAFQYADAWAVQVAGRQHVGLVSRFATRGADKFAGGEFVPGEGGVPLLPDAPVRLLCASHARYYGGDHTILVGRVRHVELNETPPVLYFRRGFHRIDDLRHTEGG